MNAETAGTMTIKRFGTDWEEAASGHALPSMTLHSLEQVAQAKRLIEQLNDSDDFEYWGGVVEHDGVAQMYDAQVDK